VVRHGSVDVVRSPYLEKRHSSGLGARGNDAARAGHGKYDDLDKSTNEAVVAKMVECAMKSKNN
jgi:hypothetical protein